MADQWTASPDNRTNSAGQPSQPQGFWGRFESSFVSEVDSLAGRAQAGFSSLSRGVTDLFPANGLDLVQVSQYFYERYEVPALEASSAFLQRVVEEIKGSTWEGLKSTANNVFGSTGFETGLVYGLAESLVKDVWSLLGLAEMLCLAGFYEHLHATSVLAAGDPITWALAKSLDQIPWVHSEMQACHDRVEELRRDLGEIARHPGEFFKAVGRDLSRELKGDWDAFVLYSERPNLKHGFQAGRAVGRVLYQVIGLVILVGGAVKITASIAAKFPQLARIASIVQKGGKLVDLEVPERMAAGGASTEQEIAQAAKVKDPPIYKGKLRGEGVELKGVETERIIYTKRDPLETSVLRKTFDSKTRPEFLKYLATDPDRVAELRNAGFSDSQIQAMADFGKSPTGWNVHHKLPLDDGGTNDFSNLVLIENEPYHKVITAAQKSLTGTLAPGSSATIDFPVPPGYVYPPTPQLGQ